MSARQRNSTGKRLVAGTYGGNFAVARYNADGTPDATFSQDGKLTTDFGTRSDEAYNFCVLPNDKFLVWGVTSADTTTWQFGLARYNSDGTLDTTFGTGGKLYTGLGRGDKTGGMVVVRTDGFIDVFGWGRE